MNTKSPARLTPTFGALKKLTFNLRTNAREEEEEVPAEDDDGELYDLINARHLKGLQDERTLHTDDIDKLQDGLAPFAGKQFTYSRYVDSIFDKHKFQERQQKRNQNRFHLGNLGHNLGHNLQKFQIAGSGAAASGVKNLRKLINENQVTKGVKEISDKVGVSQALHTLKNVERKIKTGVESGVERLKSGVETGVERIKSGVETGVEAMTTGVDMMLHKTGVENIVQRTRDFGERVVDQLGFGDESDDEDDDVVTPGGKEQSAEVLEAKAKKAQQRLLREATEHSNLLKNFKKEVAKELIQEVYQHYPFFINTSKEIAQMDADLFELEKLWNDMKNIVSTCKDAKQPSLKLIRNAPTSISLGSASKAQSAILYDAEDGETTHLPFPSKITPSKIVSIVQKVQELNGELIQYINSQNWENAVNAYHEGNSMLNQYFHIQQHLKFEHEKLSSSKGEAAATLSYAGMQLEETFGLQAVNAFQDTSLILKSRLLEELKQPTSGFTMSTMKSGGESANILQKADPSPQTPSSTKEAQSKSGVPKTRKTSLDLSEAIEQKYFKRVKLLVKFLSHDLHMHDKAAKAFLESRHRQLQYNMNQLAARSVGDPIIYCKFICELFFEETILDTCDAYYELFSESETPQQLSSSFMKWVVKILQIFCNHMRTNIFELQEGVSLELASEAMKLVNKYSTKLSDKGIFVSYLFRESFRRDLERAVEGFIEKHLAKLEKQVTLETWEGGPKRVQLTATGVAFEDIKPEEEEEDERSLYSQKSSKPKKSNLSTASSSSSITSSMSIKTKPQQSSSSSQKAKETSTEQYITSSGMQLYSIISQFIILIEPITSIQLYRTIVAGMVRLIEDYLIAIYRTANSNMLINDQQFFSLISNVSSTTNCLIPQVSQVLKQLFGNRELPELQRLQGKTQDFDKKVMTNCYCVIRSLVIFERLQFHQSDYYPKKIKSMEELSVTPTYKQFILHLDKLRKMMHSGNFQKYLPKSTKDVMLPTLVEKIVEQMQDTDGEFWIRLSAGLPKQKMSQKKAASDDEEEEEEEDHRSNDGTDQDVSDEEDEDDEKPKRKQKAPAKPELKKKEEPEEDIIDDELRGELFKKFTIPEVNSVVLDLKFMLQTLNPVLNETTKDALEDMIEFIGSLYAQANKIEIVEAVREDDFYDDLIENTLKQSLDLKNAVYEFEAARI